MKNILDYTIISDVKLNKLTNMVKELMAKLELKKIENRQLGDQVNLLTKLLDIEQQNTRMNS